MVKAYSTGSPGSREARESLAEASKGYKEYTEVRQPAGLGWQGAGSHTESLRLEKASKIITSSHHPNPTTPAKPCPQVPHPHLF